MYFTVFHQVLLIISDPDEEGGRSVDAPVELVDIFPTMVDLAGLDQIDLCDKDVEESRKEKACRLFSVAINEHIIIQESIPVGCVLPPFLVGGGLPILTVGRPRRRQTPGPSRQTSLCGQTDMCKKHYPVPNFVCGQ